MHITFFALLALNLSWAASPCVAKAASNKKDKGKSQHVAGAEVGMKAPDFDLQGLDGKRYVLSQLKKENFVLLDFWAAWCTVCKEELPLLNKLNGKYSEQGMKFFAVNYNDSKKTVGKFFKDNPIDFPVLLDSDGKVTEEDFDIIDLPMTLIVDRKGVIVYRESAPPEAGEIENILKDGGRIKTAGDETKKEKYGLAAGEKAPDFTVKTDAGKKYHLKEILGLGPVVLVFYRGGWCPFCQIQLRELQKNLDEFQKRGATLAALSVDNVEHAEETMSKEHLGFPLLSDPGAEVLELYRLKFKLDDDLLKKYEKFGIDVEKASGKKHHQIAVPAVYVIGRDGIIHWGYANEDYKVRARLKDILNALDELK